MKRKSHVRNNYPPEVETLVQEAHKLYTLGNSIMNRGLDNQWDARDLSIQLAHLRSALAPFIEEGKAVQS